MVTGMEWNVFMTRRMVWHISGVKGRTRYMPVSSRDLQLLSYLMGPVAECMVRQVLYCC